MKNALQNGIIVAAKDGENMAHGKKFDQKMKPYLVYDYLTRQSDINHVVSAGDILGYLQECGISAERRSIYKDIEEMNKALLLTQRSGYGIFAIPKAYTLEEAEELLKDDKENTIIYDEHRKGYYVRKRHYKVDDIRLLAECVYAAKFIDEKRAKRLANVVCNLPQLAYKRACRLALRRLSGAGNNSQVKYDCCRCSCYRRGKQVIELFKDYL